MPQNLQEIYRRLLDALGPQHWWPADSAFEMMVAAVLVQNTSWQNVKRAIENLRQADLLEPHALDRVPEEELQELIRPAGYFRVKAKRLRSLVHFLVRALRRLARGDVSHRAGRLAEGTAGRSRRRPGNGRFDPALRRRSAPLRGRRLHLPHLRPARLDRLRRRLPSDPGVFPERFAGRRGRVQ